MISIHNRSTFLVLAMLRVQRHFIRSSDAGRGVEVAFANEVLQIVVLINSIRISSQENK